MVVRLRCTQALVHPDPGVLSSGCTFDLCALIISRCTQTEAHFDPQGHVYSGPCAPSPGELRTYKTSALVYSGVLRVRFTGCTQTRVLFSLGVLRISGYPDSCFIAPVSASHSAEILTDGFNRLFAHRNVSPSQC